MTGPRPPIDALEAKLIADGRRIRRIFFRDLILNIAIGVHESELHGPQRVAINLSLYVRVAPGDTDDALENVFDYDVIRRTVTTLSAGPHTNLQETLIENIADTCLAFADVLGVRASIQKLDVYDNCAGVGIEIVRVKDV